MCVNGWEARKERHKVTAHNFRNGAVRSRAAVQKIDKRITAAS